MNVIHTVNLDITVDANAWLSPKDFQDPKTTLDDVISEMQRLGNHIYEVDVVNQRVKVIDVPPTNPLVEVWTCDFCPSTQPTVSKYRERVAQHEQTCKHRLR
jgi:hypothetical protein